MSADPQVPNGWVVSDADRAYAEAIQPRLPSQLSDIHAHPYRTCDTKPLSEFMAAGPEVADIGAWREYIGSQVGDERLAGGLLTPMPSRDGDLDAANAFTAEQVAADARCRGSMLVSPSSTREQAEAWVDEHPGIVGFKPYHFYADLADTFQAELGDYVPEWIWQMADDRGMVILLHMVKDGALADPANQEAICGYCRRHPNAKLILAHAARGFHAPNTVNAIATLRGLNNVWFDTAAICEPDALAAILYEFGPRKLLWGTDFPVSQQRGRAITLGTGFAFVTTDQMQWTGGSHYGEPVVVGLESTRAVLDAADRMGLTDEDLRDIFYENAQRLLGIQEDDGARTQDLYRHAKTLIPGGTQLLSKRPELCAPDQWPAYFREARGCEVWDLDGRHYYDCGFHGIGAAVLGFRDPDVTRAVIRRVNLGGWSTLNPPEEVAVAERLCELHPWAEQARFTRAGGEALAVAVRIARATTDRSVVAVCGYHGWHDWYLAANLGEDDALRGHLLPGLDPLGVPRELRGTTLPFTYNNREEFQKIIDESGPRLAAVVMEPCRYYNPEPGFLEYVRDQAHKAGALLVFDEVTIGWRLVYGGAHLRLGVDPDMAVFGKSLSNGHLLAAVIGTESAMEGAHGSFISSSYWTESVGPAAALATLDKMDRVDVPAHCERIGARFKQIWQTLGERHGLPLEHDDGFPAVAHFTFKHDLGEELRTLFSQLMLERGFLARPNVFVTLAHTEEILEKYEPAADEAFGEMAEALRKGDVEKRLKGPVAHSGFRRLL